MKKGELEAGKQVCAVCLCVYMGGGGGGGLAGCREPPPPPQAPLPARLPRAQHLGPWPSMPCHPCHPCHPCPCTCLCALQAEGWPMKRREYEALVALVRPDAEK
jgi:hypothetical protein